MDIFSVIPNYYSKPLKNIRIFLSPRSNLMRKMKMNIIIKKDNYCIIIIEGGVIV